MLSAPKAAHARTRESGPPPVKVLRARRPQALLVEAEDRRTFREHEPQMPSRTSSGLRARYEPPPTQVGVYGAPELKLNLQPIMLAEYGRSESKLW